MLAAAICGKARIGKAATSGGLVGTIVTASGTGVGHLTTASSLGTRSGTNGPSDAKLLEAFFMPLPTPQCIGHHALLPMATGTSATTTRADRLGKNGSALPLRNMMRTNAILKGGRSGPKGNFHFKGVEKCLGKGIGKGT